MIKFIISKILFKLFYKPFRGLSHLPQYIYESLDRITFCKVIEKFNLILIGKQNDNKLILFRMVDCLEKDNLNNITHLYSLIPIHCLPYKEINNQCISGVTHDEVLDRIYILCIDGQIFIYDLNILLNDFEFPPSLSNILI